MWRTAQRAVEAETTASHSTGTIGMTQFARDLFSRASLDPLALGSWGGTFVLYYSARSSVCVCVCVCVSEIEYACVMLLWTECDAL